MSSARLTTRELNRATLARQLLLQRTTTLPPLAVIERLAGLQAQLARPPFVGLWTRIAGFERDHLHRLILDKRVVRGTFMRCTIHLVSAADYLAFRGALDPAIRRVLAAVKGRHEAIDIAKVAAFARTKLPATFDTLRGHLAKKFPAHDDRAMGLVVRVHVPLVQVPSDTAWSYSGKADFAHSESWLGAKLAAATSPHALVRRYLAAFGPATPKDAMTWSGLPDLKPIFDALRPELVTFRDDKQRELFDLPDAPRPPADTPAPVRFLPEYDNLLLGHDDRRRVIADAHRARVVTKNLMVKGTFLVEGFAAGTWTTARSKARSTLTLEPFAALARPARAALEAEAEPLLRFLDPDATTFAISVRR